MYKEGQPITVRVGVESIPVSSDSSVCVACVRKPEGICLGQKAHTKKISSASRPHRSLFLKLKYVMIGLSFSLVNLPGNGVRGKEHE